MDELNTTQSVETIDQQGFDALTFVDMGEAVALSQIAEDGTLHNIVIGHDQAEKLLKLLARVLG